MSDPAPDTARAAAPVRLSIIVAAPHGFATHERLMRHLNAQTAKAQCELVLVAPPQHRAAAEALELSGYPRMTFVPFESHPSHSACRAEGFRRASAPFAVLTEDHCLPAPDWAEALINAHERGYDVVSPVILNGNPDTLRSWASLAVHYGPWLAPQPSREMAELPGHQCSYRRSLLLEHGPSLAGDLDIEHGLHARLRAHGARLVLESGARVHHINITAWRSLYLDHIPYSRLFAATRAQGWSVPRRLAYALAFPAIGLVRLARHLPQAMRTPDARRRMPMLAVAIAGMLGLSAYAEALGYAFGAGTSARDLDAIEHDRERHLAPGDQVVDATHG